jgi:small subunit ribosomal protein S17
MSEESVSDESVSDETVSDETVSDETVAGEAVSAAAVGDASTGTPAASASAHAVVPDDEAAPRKARKVREGIVVSDKMEQTAVVAVVERVRHRKYAKTVQRTKKLYVHDVANDAHIGDRVRVAETRPLSKLKRWRLVEVLERAK